MRGLLLDTHVWVWYLSGSTQLPDGLRSVIDEASDRCWLSPISIWELGLLQARGRIRVEGRFEDWVRKSREHLPWREAGLNAEVALASLSLELPHRDPADRFLAATALTYELQLATVDAHLGAAAWLPTVNG